MNYASTAQVDRTSNGALSSRAPVHTIRRADFQPIGIRFFFLFFFSSFSLELMDLEDKYIQKTKKKVFFLAIPFFLKFNSKRFNDEICREKFKLCLKT